jgi:hypothetical protein
MSKKKHKRDPHIVVGWDGPPCPRCGRAMQIREHERITEKHLLQPFYYSRWHSCMHRDCRTTIVHDDRFKVFMFDSPRPIVAPKPKPGQVFLG